MVTMLLISLLR